MSEVQTAPRRTYELVLKNARLIDPASGRDGLGAIAINNGRIAALGELDPSVPARRVIDMGGRVLSPGLIDLHTHVYEWVTNFGVNADEAGVHSGVTTCVDQGSSGAWTYGGFDAHVIEPSITDVRAFVSINVAGALMGGMKGDILHNPSMASVEDVVRLVARHPHRVKGIKCHAESGAMSHWGIEVLEMAAAAGREANVPLYVHTGELFPVVEANRPESRTVVDRMLHLLKPGDTLAHIYSCKPDGIVGEDEDVPEVVYRALEQGVHFDIGYGQNFSYKIARMMLEKGVLPNTISSDIHGDFNRFHDNHALDYSLVGAMSRLMALGMPLMEVLRRVTVNPATVLGEADEIGTLAVGSRADITVFDMPEEDWTMTDCRGEKLITETRFVPHLVVRNGIVHKPRNLLLTDVLSGERRAKL
jgi:dihydroorotase